MEQAEERRSHKRIKKPFIARFQILSEDGNGGIFPGWDIVNVQDLGAGGILFNYHDTLFLNSKLEFKINLPTLKEPINCKGRVVRVQEDPSSSRVRIASLFTDISIEERNEIKIFSEELDQKEL